MNTVRPNPFAFDSARDAIDAVSIFESLTLRDIAYEVAPLHEGADRTISGWTARLKDEDGFGIGYLAPSLTA